MGASWRTHRRTACGVRVTFEVIPAIDLRGGKCVRLLQGDYAKETAVLR